MKVADGSCRIRRIKCDERKPNCMNCISTGRKCEGYVQSTAAENEELQHFCLDRASDCRKCLGLYRLSPRGFTDSARERRAFQYFQSKVVPEVCDVFSAHYWQQLALQLGQSEPIVRHALLALSAVYEEYQNNRREEMQSKTESSGIWGLFQKPTVVSKPLGEFALQQYNKAIQLLNQRISMGNSSLNVTLMTCLIFICLEYLRNNFDIGLKHLKSGLKILADTRHAAIKIHSPKDSRNGQEVNQYLTDFFNRLDVQATIHGSATSDFNSSVLEHWNSSLVFPTSFPSIDEARTSLGIEMCATFQFIRHRFDDTYISSLSQDGDPYTTTISPLSDHSSLDFRAVIAIETRCTGHLKNLEYWLAAFSAYIDPQPVSADDTTADSTKQNQIAPLLLYHTFAVLQLKAAFFTSQMEYDTFKANFETMVGLAWQILHGSEARSLQPSVVSFDMGLLPPLFFIALKCRHLWTRRRAIGLMRLVPEREGMWLRDPIVEYAEWKVEQEEMGRGSLGEEDILPEATRIYGETISQAVVGGKNVGVFCFRRGAMDSTDSSSYGEIITNLSPAMGDGI
jgi:hypothetical protein